MTGELGAGLSQSSSRTTVARYITLEQEAQINGRLKVS